jgi:hypothetical protein
MGSGIRILVWDYKVHEVTMTGSDISEAEAIQTLQVKDQVWDHLSPAEH